MDRTSNRRGHAKRHKRCLPRVLAVPLFLSVLTVGVLFRKAMLLSTTDNSGNDGSEKEKLLKQFAQTAKDTSLKDETRTITGRAPQRNQPMNQALSKDKDRIYRKDRNIALSPANDEKKIILFMHFHKAAGSSIHATLTEEAGLKPWPLNINGNPRELKYPKPLIEFWKYSPEDFHNFMDIVKRKHVDYIAMEWNFFKYPLDEMNITSTIDMITCLRDPYDRFVSNLFFEHIDYVGKPELFTRLNITKVKSLMERGEDNRFFVNYNRPNYYVAMLNGFGDQPWREVNNYHLTIAKERLSKFLVIFILEKPETFAAFQMIGVPFDDIRFKNKNLNRRDNVIESYSKEEFQKDNILDYELYKFAVELALTRLRDQNIKKKQVLPSHVGNVSSVKILRPTLNVSRWWPNVLGEHFLHLAKPFQTYANKSWCVSPTLAANPFTEGFFFVKVPKAASSTLTSVTLRIASKYNCFARFDHVNAQRFQDRDKKKSFLIGNIRDPASREISNIVFRFTTTRKEKKRKRNPMVELSDSEILDTLKTGPHFEWLLGKARKKNAYNVGFQLGYLNTIPLEANFTLTMSTEKVIQMMVKQVMDQYNFIVVAERMDESLVALQLLLGLATTDILYLSSKLSGSYVLTRKQQCSFLPKYNVSPSVSDYLSSHEWHNKSYGDYVLYKTVNRSLDLTIDKLGRDKFDASLQKYQQLMSKAEQQCHPIFPCSQDGAYQAMASDKNCYQKDWGCGYPCLDDLEAYNLMDSIAQQ